MTSICFSVSEADTFNFLSVFFFFFFFDATWIRRSYIGVIRSSLPMDLEHSRYELKRVPRCRDKKPCKRGENSWWRLWYRSLLADSQRNSSDFHRFRVFSNTDSSYRHLPTFRVRVRAKRVRFQAKIISSNFAKIMKIRIYFSLT